jgi:pyrroloquinoline quinone biosynthesis protein B
LLTNADLDHVLGVFSLREGAPVHLHATAGVRRVLDDSLGVSRVLDGLSGTVWHEPPTENVGRLSAPGTSAGGLLYRAIELPDKPPRFAPKPLAEAAHNVADEFIDERTGGRLIVAPDVAGLNLRLREALAECDAVLFDGTFWSSNELAGISPGALSAEAMGHVTIKDTSLPLLAGLRSRQRVYIHINNTNPILAPGSPERAAAEAAGLGVGYDGLELEL